MNAERIAELRAELDAERISYGELAEIDGAWCDAFPDADPEGEDRPLARDQLNELEAIHG